MVDIYIPTLLTFANNNIFTGSCGNMRFRIVPNITMATPKEVDMEASSMTVEIWRGEKCYELSEMEQTQTFPLSEEGRQAMKTWLEDEA